MNGPPLQGASALMQMIRSPFGIRAVPLLFFTALFVLFFSPVIFTGYLLAPNDGLNYSLPNFYSPRTLWTNLLFAGYPAGADPQTQTWYPLAFLFSLFPNSWNAYMISGYVLSACFMFGYVWTVTRSRMAGLVAGLAFSMSGFMIGRLGQVPLIHAAIWFPLIFWAIEKTRQSPSVAWTVTGSFAVACSFLGGHTQITFFGLGVAVLYGMYLGWPLSLTRGIFFRRFAIMVLGGIGLVAIQLWPTLELLEWSARARLSYSEFVRFSLSPEELLTLIFPFLFGGGGTLYDVKYFGSGNGMELPGYLGLITLLLGVLAVVGSRSNRFVRFWLAIFVAALILALGEHTPVGQWMFHLPGFNKFRAPLRHFFEITLAVSVLAGLGADYIQRKKISGAQLKAVMAGASGVFGLGLVLIWIFSGILEQTALERHLESGAHQNGMEILQVVTWDNAALWVPVAVMALALVSLYAWWQRPGSPGRRLLVLAVVVTDLGSFGWFHNWRYVIPPEPWIQPPEIAIRYRGLLNESHQRLAPVLGLHGDRDQFPVNLSRLWGIPSVTGYNPLVLSRINEMLSRYESGALLATWSSVRHRVFDILGVRYLFLPENLIDTYETQEGLLWTRENLGIQLGNGCNQSYPSSVKFVLPQDFSASQIGVISKTFCAGRIAGGEPVLSLQWSGADGVAHRKNFVMGRDTAEWGYDCEGIREQIRHPQAPVLETFSIQSPSGVPCHGYQYVTQIPLGTGVSVKRIQIQWLGKPGVVQLDKITLSDEKSGHRIPLREVTASDHWRLKETRGETRVYENLDARPRAWLVPEAVPARSQDILHALYYSNLPDGRPFDPARTALIEGAPAFRSTAYDPSGKVELVELEDTRMVLQTQSSSDAFLVTSDIFYPGWTATVDGDSVPVIRTDYVLRGLILPAGSHEVRFEYQPASFYSGLTLTLLSFTLLILWAYRSLRGGIPGRLQ